MMPVVLAQRMMNGDLRLTNCSTQPTGLISRTVLTQTLAQMISLKNKRQKQDIFVSKSFLQIVMTH